MTRQHTLGYQLMWIAHGKGSPAMKLLISLKVSWQDQFIMNVLYSVHSVVDVCADPFLAPNTHTSELRQARNGKENMNI
jgi:hypothetical protein